MSAWDARKGSQRPSTRSSSRCVDSGSTKHAPELDDLFKFIDKQLKAMDTAYMA
jgi:hypothetical protein